MPTLTIDWERSPRIIIVDAPDTEISAQQLLDLCRDAEDETENAAYEKLVDASGKESLGGGTSVGITLELQNAKIGFADRTTKLESGTVTTPDTDGKVLTDSTALFETNLVEIGDLIVNITDGSHATVIEIVSETAVLTTGLNGGTDNQFASADAYEVWEIIPCEITGGNVVAVDDVGAELDALLPTFGVYAVVSKASTGTLQEQEDIRHASFDGHISVDITGTQSGIDYPSGNTANPVNNIVDAVAINAVRQFNRYLFLESASLTSAASFQGSRISGRSELNVVITVEAGTNVDDAEFLDLSLQGSLGDTTILQRCFLGEFEELQDVRGVIKDCSIGPAKLTLGGLPSIVVRFVNCRGAGQAFAPPTLNCGGNGPEVDIQDYVGQINIENKTGASVFEISITGKLILDSTVTNGVIIVNGVGTLEDNSGVGATVINNMIQGIHLQELWKVQGLEFGNPMTVTSSARTVQDQSVSLALTGDGVTTTTVTRQTDQTITMDAPLTADLLDDSDTGATPTFTRASTGTYVDPATGDITSAAIDAPRFELEGLLIEESRTNSLKHSADIGNYGQARLSVTADATTAPDGGTNADELIEDSSASNTHLIQQLSVPVTSGVDYTFSMWAKKNTRSVIIMRLPGTGWGSARSAWFDLDAGTVSQTSGTPDGTSIEAWPDGWYRCSVTHQATATTSSSVIVYLDESPTGNGIYTGDGASSLYLWGGVLEDGTFPTSYIPTTTTTETRSADLLTYNNDAVITDTSGSIICDYTPLFDSTDSNAANIINCTNAQAGPLYVNDDTTQKIAINDGTNTGQYDPTLAAGTTFTIASRWGDSTLQTVVAGTAGTTNTYDGVFTRSAGTLYVGSTSSANHINGNIKNLKIYNVDRGATQLQVDTA